MTRLATDLFGRQSVRALERIGFLAKRNAAAMSSYTVRIQVLALLFPTTRHGEWELSVPSFTMLELRLPLQGHLGQAVPNVTT
jgi:hypothetical protein